MKKRSVSRGRDAAALVAEWEHIRATSTIPTEDGWDIFEHGDGDLAIERDDEANIFEDDIAAYAHVKARADAGHEIERIALAVHHLDDDDVIINCALGAFTRRELSRAFDLVANPDNWKLPISVERVRLSEPELLAVESACVFFAGSPVTVFVEDDGSYSITGAGYYACVGA